MRRSPHRATTPFARACSTSCANATGRRAIREWLGREGELRDARVEQVERYRAASKAADPAIAATIVGEGVGLIHAIEPAAVILERMVAEAEQLLKRGAGLCRPHDSQH